MMSVNFLYMFIIAISLSSVSSQDCGEATQTRMVKCAEDLMAAETASSLILDDEQKCRRMQLELRCMKNITDQCQSSTSGSDVFNNLMAATPTVIDLVDNKCGETNPCDYGEELLDECIDLAVGGLDEQGTQKQMCKTVDGHLSCVENVIYLCRDVVNMREKMDWLNRRHRFMQLCGRYFRRGNYRTRI
ncbi:hypothetical protein LOTGIDRAFT_238425 [Lottia gigantea]|uniref:DUF19 domain-containing protein n=1 Tax=Lottia gigantea TaxID=225164 RepID=V4AA80_LOTGI|nr:hypothetical protein LOTGIDRAFT_238425 [Lottia gigantea]ESP00859.1 hypothetical protein LOTGIDRAFT_238425 [Lottia gigantea]